MYPPLPPTSLSIRAQAHPRKLHMPVSRPLHLATAYTDLSKRPFPFPHVQIRHSDEPPFLPERAAYWPNRLARGIWRFGVDGEAKPGPKQGSRRSRVGRGRMSLRLLLH